MENLFEGDGVWLFDDEWLDTNRFCNGGVRLEPEFLFKGEISKELWLFGDNCSFFNVIEYGECGETEWEDPKPGLELSNFESSNLDVNGLLKGELNEYPFVTSNELVVLRLELESYELFDEKVSTDEKLFDSCTGIDGKSAFNFNESKYLDCLWFWEVDIPIFNIQSFLFNCNRMRFCSTIERYVDIIVVVCSLVLFLMFDKDVPNR